MQVYRSRSWSVHLHVFSNVYALQMYFIVNWAECIMLAKSEEVHVFINLQSLEVKSDDYRSNCEPTLKPLTKESSSLTSTCLLLSQPLYYRHHWPICDEWTVTEHFTVERTLSSDWLNRLSNGSANTLR